MRTLRVKLAVLVLLIKTLSIEILLFIEDFNFIAEKEEVTFVNFFISIFWKSDISVNLFKSLVEIFFLVLNFSRTVDISIFFDVSLISNRIFLSSSLVILS